MDMNKAMELVNSFAEAKLDEVRTNAHYEGRDYEFSPEVSYLADAEWVKQEDPDKVGIYILFNLYGELRFLAGKHRSINMRAAAMALLTKCQVFVAEGSYDYTDGTYEEGTTWAIRLPHITEKDVRDMKRSIRKGERILLYVWDEAYIGQYYLVNPGEPEGGEAVNCWKRKRFPTNKLALVEPDAVYDSIRIAV